MAEDRNNSQGLVGQAHTIEHGSSPPAVSALSTGPNVGIVAGVTSATTKDNPSIQDNSPPRSPRTLLLQRGENGFGFTLRHFIVYPPESCFMLPDHERTKIDEPMDTIFVKQVRENSPAAEAGLRTGDRVVSVDGKPTRGEQYAKVVQRIQQAGPWLRLLVVSKEDDILQRYFGETAHNPETNQRPRLRSPERSGHRQRRSVSMIPGLSPRTRQSWVCSAPSSMPTPLCQDQELARPLIDDGVSSRDQDFSEEIQQSSESNDKTQSAKSTIYRSKPSQEIISRYESVEDNKVKLRNQPQQLGKDTSNLTVMQSYDRSMQSDMKYNDKYDHFDRTRSESIYSRTNSDQIYDRIKDPIYEPVRFGESLRTNIDHHSSHHHHHHHHHYHPHPPNYHHYQQESPQQQQQQQQKQQQSHQHSSLTRVPLSRAEPQVPIYRPASKRISSRRASEGSTSGSMINNFETASYLSTDALRSCEPRSRFGIDSRRDSSSIHANDPSSYESSSTLVGNEANESRNENGRNGNLSGHRANSGTSSSSGINIGNTNIDDSIIMTRLRKSFEQKEEFLRRPSQPIGWFLPEERSESPVRNNNNGTVIPREFYARPQKFQKQVWPPTDSKQDQQLSILKSAQNSNRTFPGKLVSDKSSSNQNVQRMKSSNDGAEEIDYFTSRNEQIEETSNTTHPLEYMHQQIVTPNVCDRLSTPSSCDDNRDSKESDKHQQQLQRNVGKSSNFVGTLSRIHENIASVGALLSGERQSIDGRNGASSLPSSPGPEKKMNDKFPILPQGLQIVSKRAKQFESGRLLSDDDEPTGDRTNLYRSELSRLSNKRSVPNVAVRKREFESKAEAQEPRRLPPVSTRETKSLDSETSNPRIIDGEHVQSRIRSNSAESWESTSANNMLETARHHWSRRQDDTERKRNINGNDDSIYVDTTRSSDENAIIVEKGSRSQQQDDYTQIIKTEHGMLPSDNDTHNNQVVFRRQKNTQIADEDRATRRVSYLKATWGERIHVDSDLELSDYEPVIHTSRSGNTREPAVTDIVKDVGQMEREGPLHVKFTVLDGKRSSDRSWKQLWGILRGPILFFYKDRQNQSPSLACDGENVAQSVDVRCSLVDIAEDYTKRKHVLRLANPNAEVLLQTEDAASMALWLRALHEHAAAEKPSEIAQNSTLKQQAVPQTPGPTNSSSPCQMNSVTMTVSTSSGSGSQRLSPLPGHKGIKKLTSFRNRSPTGQSPINKTRKPSQTIDNLVSPKTKTWKGRVAKQLRKMHGQTASPSSPTTQLPPEGATFKVPLELCPPSSFSEYVPLIVEMCTSIVEARGLEVVGIYRVPGNTAAISHLTDSVNKGFENINLQDPRWSDVNVISSLLKSFFRQLPDSLLTAELYPMFIDADKVEDPQRRMTTIRKLLRDLPEHHFATLKYLMFHLKRIVEHSEVNKMEAKNLAIVFGPTLVRASGSRDNMVTMVTDMSHQCRIVESLLNNVDWFFSDDDLDDLSRLSVNLSLPADTSEIETTTSSNNHNLLLNNIQKVEGVREMASAKDIVSSIISAANRKIQRRRKCQDETDNETHEVDKPRMKQDTENLQNRRSMALNERQCSVSEIVLMHENQNQSNRSIDRSTDRSDDRSPTLDGIAHASTDDIIADCAITNRDMLNNHDNVVPSEKSNKYLNRTIESVPSMQSPIHRSTVSSTSESSRLSSETGLSCFDASSTLSSASNDTKQSNDEITIRTYAGLSATTQERIRRFEQETKAMLQRDQNRQRREAERREEERRRIETEWQLAKNEMENDDLLDSIVDSTVMTPTAYLSSATRLSNFNDKSYLDIGSRSTGRVPHLSIAVQQQPTSVRRVSLLANESTTILPQENISDSTIKKLKTDTEQILEGSTLSSIRYGSLDSLHETHEISQSSLSPTNQQRKPLSSDVSDDGSDLLTSLTTTFDRKWRSLVNSSNQTIRGTTMENLSLSDEDAVITQRDSQNLRNQRGGGGGGGGGLREEKDQEKTTISQSSFSIESYRDPSLHKMCIEKHQYDRQKNDAPEKDTDSSVTENSSVDRLDDDAIPDNDRSAIARKKIESSKETVYESSPDTNQAQEYCRIEKEASVNLSQSDKVADDAKDLNRRDTDSNYSNKLEKFESLTKFEVRSRLKRSESLNKRSENTSSKLKRSESLNKHSVERLSSPTNGKLKRSESLNKHSERSDSPNSKLKRSESLTKTEKTECNISKRRQSVRKDSATKLKRKNGMPERSIKRRHTVGGTKDFDKVHWLDNKLQVEAERVVKNEYRPKKSQLRTSSPDLSTGRIGLTDASFLIEVSFRGPSNVVFNVTNARPQSLPDTSLASKVFKVPLESHV
ncbi:uncharacterized protein LOC107994952 isoform X8 [Apis cerana]|uniref:uncharacterized protein LOC107994952 isoform X8 n=1 Tax=Apis cerana TaxID=7461 RepID=UPI002B2220E2|nr:uncharacterized protein LOC107994952 isoform X8 [Apis cerana]